MDAWAQHSEVKISFYKTDYDDDNNDDDDDDDDDYDEDDELFFKKWLTNGRCLLLFPVGTIARDSYYFPQ